MMNKIIGALVVICAMTLSACEESNGLLCGGNDPANELEWLKQEINRLSTSTTSTSCNSISRSTYKEQTVFIFSNCSANVNSIPFLYDCNGTKLNLSPGDYQALKFSGEIELIWKSK